MLRYLSIDIISIVHFGLDRENTIRFCPHLKRFAQRLAEKALSSMSILGAVVRKLLLLVRALVVSGKDYEAGYGEAPSELSSLDRNRAKMRVFKGVSFF